MQKSNDYVFDLCQNKEEKFKQNYKFIDFKKSTDITCTNNLTNESITEFYKELISGGENEAKSNEQVETKLEKPELKDFKKSLKNDKKLSQKDFLSAAQNNDLSLIKNYIESGSDITVLDDFKWNALMISIASFNNKIVDILLNEIDNLNLVNSSLTNKDLSGNTAESLAIKFKNINAIEMIKNFKIKLDKVSQQTSETNEIDKEKVENIDFYCQSCNRNFNSKDETHLEHLTSIVHQLNQTDQDTEKKRKLLANYHLRRSNKGYELMLKSGWNEHGLGLNEQGITNPIKTKVKLDRYGLGIQTKSSKIYSKSTKLIKLKTSKSDSIVNRTKTKKDIIESNKKIEKFERNLRMYFDI